jgi:hypothetical protein
LTIKILNRPLENKIENLPVGRAEPIKWSLKSLKRLREYAPNKEMEMDNKVT